MFDGFQPRPQMTGFTSLPNEFFQYDVLSNLKEAELKILLATFRKTYGWIDRIENGEVIYKLEDDISYSQYRDMTGLSDASISSALKKLIEKGYMTRVRVGNQSGLTSRYKIRIKGESPDEEYEDLDSKESTGTSGDVGAPPPPASGFDAISIDDIYGSRKKSNHDPAPTKRKGNYVANFTAVWRDSCRRKGFHVPVTLSARDRKHVKDLAEAYGQDEIHKYAEFFIMNFKAIADTLGITSGEPTLPVLWGFRNSIVPMAKTGIIGFSRPKPNKGREFDEDKFKKGGGDFWQT